MAGDNKSNKSTGSLCTWLWRAKSETPLRSVENGGHLGRKQFLLNKAVSPAENVLKSGQRHREESKSQCLTRQLVCASPISLEDLKPSLIQGSKWQAQLWPCGLVGSYKAEFCHRLNIKEACKHCADAGKNIKRTFCYFSYRNDMGLPRVSPILTFPQNGENSWDDWIISTLSQQRRLLGFGTARAADGLGRSEMGLHDVRLNGLH